MNIMDFDVCRLEIIIIIFYFISSISEINLDTQNDLSHLIAI